MIAWIVAAWKQFRSFEPDLGKPLKTDWLLRNGYAKDGRDHR